MIERWLPVKDFPDYEVSDAGRVRRIVDSGGGLGRAGDILRPRFSTGVKYPSVALTRNGVRKHWFVHRLVAHVFLGPCPDGMEVNHKNGDCADPRLKNLEYVTRSENLKHAFENGLKTHKGERNSRARLTEQDVLNIRREYSGRYGECAEFARRYGVSHAAIQDVLHGRSWVGVIP